jgi:5-formyltetrahydrofolate cyclo-ligase
MAESDGEPAEHASPACFLHELDPACAGLPRLRAGVMRWRKSERERLAVPATERGATCALPVVSERSIPLRFRIRKHGDRMERGIWNILAPADGEEVVPDMVIAPLVGFDGACYRLGYGRGYFDHALAGLRRKPLVMGAATAASRSRRSIRCRTTSRWT